MAITKQLVRSVRQSIADKPGIALSRLADVLGASEVDVMTVLPVPMRMKANAGRLEELWDELAGWEDVEVSLRRPNGGVLTVPAASLPAGPLSGALARLYIANGLPPLIREERRSAWFLSRNTEQGDRLSVCFFNGQGEHVLSVHLCRERASVSVAEKRAAYEGLRSRFGVVPKPALLCGSRFSCAGKGCAQNGKEGVSAHVA